MYRAVANGVVGVALTTPVFGKSQGKSFKMLLLFCDFPIQPPWFQKVIYSSVMLLLFFFDMVLYVLSRRNSRGGLDGQRGCAYEKLQIVWWPWFDSGISLLGE